MAKYSQNLEDDFIADFFKGQKGALCSIGENDGRMFSNALRLIEDGWSAVLFEPSPKAYKSLKKLHTHRPNVRCLKVAVGERDQKAEDFYESGPHLPDQSDIALLSTLNKKEKVKWVGVGFNKISVDVITWDSFLKMLSLSDMPKEFDFITIDAEGSDVIILKQIDLTNTSLLCIEWNSIEQVKKEILDYTAKFGMTNIIYQSAENLLIAR